MNIIILIIYIINIIKILNRICVRVGLSKLIGLDWANPPKDWVSLGQPAQSYRPIFYPSFEMRGGYRPYLLPNRPHLSPLPLSSLLRLSLLNRFTHHTLFILTATHHSFSPKVKVKTPAFHFHIFFYLISLHFTFWRFCWPIVGSEVLQLFGKFHSKDSIVANAKFFVLILKKGGVEDIKDFRSLPDKFVAFSSFLGLPVTGFEKESNSLLWKLESRKGRGVKITRGKKKSPLATRLEREIRKLECSVNYDSHSRPGKGQGCWSLCSFSLRLLSRFVAWWWVLGSRWSLGRLMFYATL